MKLFLNKIRITRAKNTNNNLLGNTLLSNPGRGLGNTHNTLNTHKRLNKDIQNGGKFLGKGSYGCVITPSLSCESDIKKSKLTRKLNKRNSNSKSKDNSKNNSSTVSKIILKPNDYIKDEISISNKLKSIDPEQQYFLTINKYCKVKKIPTDRSNIAKVEYLHNYNNNDNNDNNSNKYKYKYHKLEKKSLDKKYCPVDLSRKPINLIMSNGGYDLIEIADIVNYYGIDGIDGIDGINSINVIDSKYKKHSQTNIDELTKHKITTSKMLFRNLKECIKNLLKGLLKMHQNRIVNRDIKEENIMANYDDKNKKMYIRYIDYGLSEMLTPNYCSRYNNINVQGTNDLIPAEIYITYYINKYMKTKKTGTSSFSNSRKGLGNKISNFYSSIYNAYSKNSNKTIKSDKSDKNDKNDKYIMSLINESINEYIKKMLKSLNISTIELNNIVIKLYNEIKTMFNNNTILDKYFGVNDILNGFLQKGDVYALGLTLYELLDVYTNVIDIKKDIRLYDLLKHMIDLNPNTRYNALQCLKHPYFTH